MREWTEADLRRIRRRATDIRRRRHALGIRGPVLDAIAGCEPGHVEWSERSAGSHRIMQPGHPSLRPIITALEALEQASRSARKRVKASSVTEIGPSSEVQLWFCPKLSEAGVWLTEFGCDRQHDRASMSPGVQQRRWTPTGQGTAARRGPARDPINPDQLHPCIGCAGVRKVPAARSKIVQIDPRSSDGE